MSDNFEKLVMALTIRGREETNICSLVKLYSNAKSEAEKKPTFALWLNYIQMVEVLLMFLRATRENNWDLHLSTVWSMLPWFFATDRVHYARYGTVYWAGCSAQMDHVAG